MRHQKAGDDDPAPEPLSAGVNRWPCTLRRRHGAKYNTRSAACLALNGRAARRPTGDRRGLFGCGADPPVVESAPVAERIRGMTGTAIEQEAQRQLAILKARCVDLLVEEELHRKLCRSLATRTPLRVKLGLDPTAPDLHIGHTVVIHKLREFQLLGHEVIFLIGDFTGRIGDPTGRSETRKPLTEAQIAQNAETYKRQIFKILDPHADGDRLQQPVGQDPRLGRDHQAGRPVHGGPHAGAGRFPEALRRGPSHQHPRVPVPAAPGVRLRGAQGRRGARRDRPEVQSAGRARAAARGRPGATGHHDAADPGRARRRAEDEQEPGELHRYRRAPAGHFREGDVHPRRADRAVHGVGDRHRARRDRGDRERAWRARRRIRATPRCAWPRRW